MPDFETELEELIDKHREFPGADIRAMAISLAHAGAELMVETATLGPHTPEFTGL